MSRKHKRTLRNIARLERELGLSVGIVARWYGGEVLKASTKR